MGWWDVRRGDGRVATRYVSEFQAWEAGRALAERCGAHLVIRQEHGPAKYGVFDPATRRLRPLIEVDMYKAPSWETGPSRRLVLVVAEGGNEARERYVEILDRAGYSVVTSKDGPEAVTVARVLQPDLVLMDARLSESDGIAAADDLRADPTLSNVPILAITRDPSEESCARARRAGCIVIPAPLVPEQVAIYVTQVLQGDPARMPDAAGQL